MAEKSVLPPVPPKSKASLLTLKDTLKIEMNTDRFMGLMEKVIPLSKVVQNNPAQGLFPQEGLVCDQVEATLKPFTVENGGPLKVERHSYAKGRANLIITCPGRNTKDIKYISFVGSHMDVVPCDPEDWDFDPFKLVQKGDLLLGRGTTDCLGHVCLVTDFLCSLAEKQIANKGQPVLNATVVAVFIASEENGSGVNKGVGIDGLAKRGLLDHLKSGAVLWIDCADSNPCMATASALQWTMKVMGRKAHSGLPHIGINALELGMEVMKYIQDRFYKDYPVHKDAPPYKFPIASSMKPTQMKCAPGALNQIPVWMEMQGDIRLTPFYDAKECMAKVEQYVAELNSGEAVSGLPSHGPFSKYILNLDTEDGSETVKGRVLFEFMDKESPMRGIACDLTSPGFAALTGAIMDVKGKCNPASLTGSLPLVQDLKEAGFDLQLVGFGLSSKYHQPNEACKLSDMIDGTKVLSAFASKLDQVL